jgi:hypothetical protein
MVIPTREHEIRKRVPAFIRTAAQRRKEFVLTGEDIDAKALTKRGNPGELSLPEEDIFTSAAQNPLNPLRFPINRPPCECRLSGRLRRLTTQCCARRLLTLTPSPLEQSFTPCSRLRTSSSHPPLSLRELRELSKIQLQAFITISFCIATIHTDSNGASTRCLASWNQ